MPKFLILLFFFGLLPMPAFPYEKFPARPIHGLFKVTSSTPSIEGIDPGQFNKTIFFPEQKIRFQYLNRVGYDWPNRDEYRVTLYPPFNKHICLHSKWRYLCDAEYSNNPEIPDKPVIRDAYLDTERLQKNFEIAKYLKPYLKRADYHFTLMYSDASAVYDFYFMDWDTIVFVTDYGGNYNDDLKSSMPKTTFVVQILKRIKE